MKQNENVKNGGRSAKEHRIEEIILQYPILFLYYYTNEMKYSVKMNMGWTGEMKIFMCAPRQELKGPKGKVLRAPNLFSR